MNIRQLQYFVDLSETLNFTKTAQNFYISQTAITKQIQCLEGDLDIPLFHRSKKSVSLTSEGQANIVFYLIFVCIQMILERKISMKFILEIPFSFIFGFLVDLYQYIIPTINLNLYTQILVLLIGNTCCAIGVYFMIKGNLIMTPVDGLVLSISEVFHRPYSLCKNIFDISMILATIIICLICHSSIYGVGIGTVFSAFYIGRVISVLENFKFKTYKKCY